MARYFKAPVVQPIDYGFDMPFQQVMATLQHKQKVQDDYTAGLEAGAEKSPQALFKDADVRLKYMKEKEARTDALLYDEKGNVKELSNSAAAIRAEARRQMKDEHTGGKFWALDNSYKIWDKYEASIDARTDIGIERKNWLKSDSRRRYAGIGEKDQYSEQDLFNGILGQKEVDEYEIVDKALKGWEHNKFQISGGGPGGQVSPTAEYLQKLQEVYPEYRNVLGGDYKQTGTMEYVIIDDLFRHGEKTLSNNQEVMNDLQQEAEQKGYTSPEDIQKYVSSKIKDAALTAAEKYSYARFTPQTVENWRAKMEAQDGYDRARIEWEDDRNMRTLQQDNGDQQNTFKISDIVSTKKTAQEMVDKLKGNMKEFYNEDGTLTEAAKKDPTTSQRYIKMKSELAIAQSEIVKSNRILLNQTDPNKLNLQTGVAGSINNQLSTLLKDWGVQPGTQAYTYINGQYKNIVGKAYESYTPEQITKYLVDYGSLPPKVVDALGAFQKVINKIEPGKTGAMNSIDARLKSFSSDALSNINAYTNAKIESALYGVNTTGEIPYTDKFPTLVSYSGAGTGDEGELGAITNTITESIEMGQGEFTNPLTGQPLKVNDFLVTNGLKKGKFVVTTSSKVDDTGSPIFVISGINGKGQSVQLPIMPTPGTTNSYSPMLIEMSSKMLRSAMSKQTSPQAVQDVQIASQMIGQLQFGSEIAASHIEHSPPGAKVFIANESTIIEKTPDGNYVVLPVMTVNGRKVPDYNNPIKDSRKHTQEDARGNILFNSLNEVYQLLGEAVYPKVLNTKDILNNK